jgi:phenylpropionate dioxygenase-like ring-hydroxylating dioxygenase large terminal subunit
MSDFLRDLWYLAALSADVRPGKVLAKTLLGDPVVLGRTRAGAAFALRDLCPHRGVPLSSGALLETPAGPLLECPFHGWRFRPDGVCAEIPSLTAQAPMRPEQVRCAAYPLHEAHGLLWIYMPGDLKRAGPPLLPPPDLGALAVGGRPKAVERRLFDLPLDHAVTGLLDPAHGPYVHQQWWWRTPAGQKEKHKRFEPRPLGFTMVRHAPSSNSMAYKLLGGAPQTEIVFELPSTRWEDVEVGPRRFVTMSWLTPLDGARTEFTQLLFWDLPLLSALAPVVRYAAARFLAQDQAMAALQRRGLAHDPAMLWIEDADVQALWYRRLKKAWALARQQDQPFTNPLAAATLHWRT